MLNDAYITPVLKNAILCQKKTITQLVLSPISQRYLKD